MKAKTIIILAAIAAAIALTWYLFIRDNTVIDDNQSTEDSLSLFEEKIQLHKDSAQQHEDSAKIYQSKYEHALDAYIGIRPGSPEWDSVVAAYKSRVRSEIQSGDSGFSSAVRINKASSGTPTDSL